MTFASAAAPTTLSQSLQQRLLQAIDENDLAGGQLIIEITAAQLGINETQALLSALPASVPSTQVPLCLALLHGEQWQQVARAIVLAAAHQLAEAGAIPGQDFSYAPQNNIPVLLMDERIYNSINTSDPDSLHLVRSFLVVQSSR